MMMIGIRVNKTNGNRNGHEKFRQNTAASERTLFFSICGVSTWLCVDQLKVQLLGICRTPAVVHTMYAAVRPTHDDHTRAR